MGRWQKKMQRAKKLHRPLLKDWERNGLYKEFPPFVKSISQRDNYETFIPSDAKGRDSPDDVRRMESRNGSSSKIIPLVLDAKDLSKEKFWDEYEGKGKPCVIKNIPNGYDGANQTKEWPAVRKWNLEALREDSSVRNRFFKCGEDDDGHSIKIKLKFFLQYLRKNRDDSPLYVFDSGFEDDSRAKNLLGEYQVPSYFSDDLFRFISESRRPPYRWFLVGPERSGTTVHIDPLATNAWNTLIFGQKRWVLFPPHVPKRIVKGRGLIRSDEDDEAIHYFMYILPRIKRRATALRHEEDYRDFACYEFTQNAGETVFIPNGWWHAVLNLTHTVGVTQNFCSPRNFDDVWLKTRTARKRMAWKWLCKLDEHYPHLADRAREMNKRDNFRMKYDPGEIKRREEKHESRKVRRKIV